MSMTYNKLLTEKLLSLDLYHNDFTIRICRLLICSAFVCCCVLNIQRVDIVIRYIEVDFTFKLPEYVALYRRIRYIEARYIEVLFHTFYCNFGRDVKSRSLYRGLGVIIFLCGISLPLFILWANFSPFPLRIAVYRILIRNNSRLLNEMTLYFDIKKY